MSREKQGVHQVQNDAKYFRNHIWYFNSQFSFTNLGVTLDQKVSTAVGTGVYISCARCIVPSSGQFGSMFSRALPYATL